MKVKWYDKLYVYVLIMFGVVAVAYAADWTLSDPDADSVMVWDDSEGTEVVFQNEAEFKAFFNMEADTDFESPITNEASLYGKISDVTDFVQPADINTLAELETVSSGGAYMSDMLAATSEANFKSIANLEAGTDFYGLTGTGTGLTALNGENIQNDTIDDDSIDFGDVTCVDLTTTDCGVITSTGKISTIVTTEQLRLGYDATNYLTATLADDGHTTIATVDPDGAEADINFTPDGNVGINTAAPSEALEVTGNAVVSGTMDTGAHTATSYTSDPTANPQLIFNDSNSASESADAYFSENNSDTGDGTEDADISLYTVVGGAATEIFTADADGASGTNNIINFPTAITSIANIVSIGNTEGVQDGGDDAALMTDGGESLTVDAYIGMTVYNVTDGSSCTITDNAGTTITCTLAGGTGDDWDDGDVWVVGPGPKQSGSAFFVSPSGTLKIYHPATVGYMALYFVAAAQVLEINPAVDGMTINFTADGVYTDPGAGDEIDGDGTVGDYIGIINESATEAHSLGVNGTWADGGAS